ncbi:gamma-glutamyl-gamma-aminobutyrate hydrolase family protein [Longispora sp. NPDC051575]|uniref:gamma-glutamyl-gamma-aminobutyrate hydrolase family protein n=1 Tax=Longispora sp. NPDC051575 TaxID=3154943 RepID=UPI003440A8C1
MRPVIGITAYREPASWSVWSVPAVLIPATYVESVAAAGGHPVVLPPDPSPDILTRLDGLILAGGADLSPARYGADPHPLTVTRPDRDESELALLAAAGDLPVLGVCRGMQVMAVAAGGTLFQHLPDEVGHTDHQPEPGRYGSHPVRFAAGSLAESVYGPTGNVNSYHHQGVADPGTLTATGWSEDGVIEVLEDPGRAFRLGVQWHPEELGDGRLFEALVRAAR